MRKWMLALALLMIGTAASAQEAIKWMDFEDAVEACKKTPKKLFVDVYTDWCGWCKKMDKTTFVDPAVVRYMNENYYAVKFDAERNDTVRFMGTDFVPVKQPGSLRSVHQLAASMLQGKMSYPSYVIFNEDLRVIQVIPGYQEAKTFLPILHFFGDNAFKTTAWKDYIESFSADTVKDKEN